MLVYGAKLSVLQVYVCTYVPYIEIIVCTDAWTMIFCLKMYLQDTYAYIDMHMLFHIWKFQTDTEVAGSSYEMFFILGILISFPTVSH